MDEVLESSEAEIEQSIVETAANEPSDGEVVARVGAGDEAAFEELFNRHRRRVALIAGRFFKGREQIEEIVQESFMKAYFALPRFNNAQDASFASWLARIAFNACYDELRRRQRRPESDLDEDEMLQLKASGQHETHGKNVEAAVIDRDLADKLLSRLSAEDRLVLVMLEAEELPVAEIAKLTGWSVSKVKVRAHRARASLRRVLGKLL